MIFLGGYEPTSENRRFSYRFHTCTETWWFHTRFHTPSTQTGFILGFIPGFILSFIPRLVHRSANHKLATYTRHLRHFAILVRALRGACVAKPVRARSAASVLFDFIQSWMRRTASGGLGIDSLRPVFFTRIRTFLDETLADS